MQNIINPPFNIDIFRYVVPDEFESLVFKQVGNIIFSAGDQIIHAHNTAAFFNQ